MSDDGRIDIEKLYRLIDGLIGAGVTGVCACGTTGQSATLSHEEHVHVAELVFRRIDSRCQYIASAGSNCTQEALDLTRNIERKIGPATFLHVTGYYNNPPQAGLLAHFRKIADSLQHDESNLILYNVPGRTRSNLDVATTVALAENPRIIGIKEASEDLDQIQAIIDQTDPRRFRVLTGECGQIAEVIERGGFGAISATANLAPRLLGQLVTAGLNEEFRRARELQERAGRAIEAVFCRKNPIPLAMLFGCGVRLPLVVLPEIHNALEQLLSCYTPDELGIDWNQYH
jgi:4-hydroxy-tetrahydrodipicolinate synthase